MKKLTYTIIFNLLVQLSVVGQITFDSSKVSDTILSICSTITKDTILMEDKVLLLQKKPKIGRAKGILWKQHFSFKSRGRESLKRHTYKKVFNDSSIINWSIRLKT